MYTHSKTRNVVFDDKYKSVWRWLDNQKDPEYSLYLLISLAKSVKADEDWAHATNEIINNIMAKDKNTPKPKAIGHQFTIFYCNDRGSNATAKYNGHHIIVKKGSKMSPRYLMTVNNGQFPHLAELVTLEKDGVIDKHGIFTRDYMFSSPSEAGNIITRRGSVNGRMVWKTRFGLSIAGMYGPVIGHKNK